MAASLSLSLGASLEYLCALITLKPLSLDFSCFLPASLSRLDWLLLLLLLSAFFFISRFSPEFRNCSFATTTTTKLMFSCSRGERWLQKRQKAKHSIRVAVVVESIFSPSLSGVFIRNHLEGERGAPEVFAPSFTLVFRKDEWSEVKEERTWAR